MQKKPISKYNMEHVPIILPEDLSIRLLSNKPHLLKDNEIIGLHIHGCMEIGYCYEGAGIFIVDHKVLPFSQGDAIILFKNQFHKAQSQMGVTSRWKYIYLDPVKLLNQIDPVDLERVYNISKGDPSFPNIITAAEHPYIVNLVSMLIYELEKCMENFQSLVKGLVWSLLTMAGRITTFQTDCETILGNSHLIKVASALEYISKNYMKPLKVKDFALQCNMSLTNFRRSFNVAIGMTPLNYLDKIRIQMACILLGNINYSILEVSQMVGYITLSSFNRNFKKFSGMAPREWKRRKLVRY